VAQVYYPGLEAHDGHTLAREQLLRLSVGIEEIKVLPADLQHALSGE
jgi:cystathionine beta-lyase/cystathionine gamma-synthase